MDGDYVDTGFEVWLGDSRRRFSLALSNPLDSKSKRFALGLPFLIRDCDQITPPRPRSDTCF